MIVRVVTHPTVEPVNLSEAKLHCRVDHSAEDDWFTREIRAARMQAERITARALISQTIECVLDCFPAVGFSLPRGKVQSITSVTYLDDAGTSQTLPGGQYLLDDVADPSWLFPAFDATWPATRAQINAVRVRYVAGYGDSGEYVPEPITSWMLCEVARRYRFRGDDEKAPERHFDALLEPFTLIEIQS